jgi:hypothetical protein
MAEQDTLDKDLSGQTRQPQDEPEKQQESAVPDDHAAWVISLLYDFEERFHKETLARAKECFRQYNQDQWPEEAKQALQGGDEKRPMLTFNHIRVKIGTLSGEERRNREDWVARPREGSDNTEADVRTALLKYVRDINTLGIDESRAFDDCGIGGWGGIVASLARRYDDPYPMLRLEYRPWHEFRWDWRSKSRNWTDAQWMAVSSMVSVDRLKELFPDWADSVATEYLSLLQDPIQPEVDYGERIGVTHYNDGNMRQLLYQSDSREIRASEFYHRTTRVRTIVSLLTADGVSEYEMPDDPEIKAIVDGHVAAGRAVKRTVKEPAIKGSLVIGRRTMAQWWSSFDGRDAFGHPMFPIFISIASDTNGRIMGLVEPMLDPQAEINKRWSMVVDNYLHIPRSGGFFEDGAFENETRDKGKLGQPGAWVKLQKGAISQGRIKFHTPPVTDQALMQLFELAGVELDKVSNMPLARMGQPSQETSGIAIRQRSLQSALPQVPIFDNFRNMQLQMGRFVNANLKLMFPVQKTLSLTMPSGESREVTLNEAKSTLEGAMRIANSTSPDMFDITMDLTPGNASFREMQAQNLASLLGQIGPMMGKIPDYQPVVLLLLGSLVKALDGLPGRDRIISVVDKIVERIMAALEQSPMLPGGVPGAPPTPGQVPGGPQLALPPSPSGAENIPPGALESIANNQAVLSRVQALRNSMGPAPPPPTAGGMPFSPVGAMPTPPSNVPIGVMTLLARAAGTGGLRQA